MGFFGVRILGFNAETLRKVVLSLVVLARVMGVRALLNVVVGLGTGASRAGSIDWLCWPRSGGRV